MPNELQTLLRDAAARPATDVDLDTVQRRGRALRARRRVASAFVAVIVVGAGAATVAAIADDSGPSPTSPAAVRSAPACAIPSTADDIPAWAGTANPPRTLPHLVSHEQNVVAVLFGYPLRAGHPTGRSNKILWIVREPRNGEALTITATLPGGHVAAVHASKSADSSPGEIYPSVVDVPAPGCWHFALQWNGNRATIDIPYVQAPA